MLQESSSCSMFKYVSAPGPLVVPGFTIKQKIPKEMARKGTNCVLKWGCGESSFCPCAPEHAVVKLTCPRPVPTLYSVPHPVEDLPAYRKSVG